MFCSVLLSYCFCCCLNFTIIFGHSHLGVKPNKMCVWKLGSIVLWAATTLSNCVCSMQSLKRLRVSVCVCVYLCVCVWIFGSWDVGCCWCWCWRWWCLCLRDSRQSRLVTSNWSNSIQTFYSSFLNWLLVCCNFVSMSSNCITINVKMSGMCIVVVVVAFSRELLKWQFFDGNTRKEIFLNLFVFMIQSVCAWVCQYIYSR